MDNSEFGKKAIRRIFIDPASISSGWACFDGTDLINHGGIKVDGDTFARLRTIYQEYERIAEEYQPDEVHIEKFKIFRTWSYAKLIGSVFIIGAAFAGTAQVDNDIHVKQWMSFAGYQKGFAGIGRLEQYNDQVETEDQLAAIGMGIWFTSTQAPER